MLLQIKAYYAFTGRFNWFAIPDKMAGKRNRYTLIITTADDPVVMGRELDLKTCKMVVKEFETAHSDFCWFGDRRTLLRRSKKFFEERRKHQ